jgi:small subunit ribosomal protein S20
MANTTSAKKAARKIAKRTAVNKDRRTEMRGTWRAVEEAISAGDQKVALEALKKAESSTRRAAGKSVLHKNTASRKVARLTKRVKAIAKA